MPVCEENFRCYPAGMSRGVCSVCSLPSDARDCGEKMISEGKKQYREIVLLSPNGPSKSAWHRHMTGCYRRRRFYGIGKPASKAEERLITQWPNGSFTLDGQPFTATFRHGDVVLKIVYEQKEIRNPAALIDAARAEDAERFPPIAMEETRAAPVVEVEADVSPQTTLSEPPEFIVVADDNIPTTPKPCEHVMVRVSGDVRRCVNCGHQEQPPTVVGVSRAEYFAQRQRRSTFGRFG